MLGRFSVQIGCVLVVLGVVLLFAGFSSGHGPLVALGGFGIVIGAFVMAKPAPPE